MEKNALSAIKSYGRYRGGKSCTMVEPYQC